MSYKKGVGGEQEEGRGRHERKRRVIDRARLQPEMDPQRKTPDGNSPGLGTTFSKISNLSSPQPSQIPFPVCLSTLGGSTSHKKILFSTNTTPPGTIRPSERWNPSESVRFTTWMRDREVDSSKRLVRPGVAPEPARESEREGEEVEIGRKGVGGVRESNEDGRERIGADLFARKSVLAMEEVEAGNTMFDGN